MSGHPAYLVSDPSLWAGCYDGGWQGEIVPEAFAHPAKVSRALIRHIYQHAFVEGWLVPGDTVVDCFGGIAGTALDAMWSGCHWVGCELEPRFVGLAQQNIDLWQRKYGSKPGFGSARIVQGDSRKLASVIAGADLVCSSPPFHDSLSNKPSAQILAGSGGRMGESCKSDDVYGQSPGQLGAMKEGEPPTVDLVCSSPPYAAIATGAGGLNTKPGKDGQQSGRNPNSASQDTDQHYGETAGQLSGMPDRGFDAVVSSPPYEGNVKSDYLLSDDGKTRARDVKRGYKQGHGCFRGSETYGDTDGQLGREDGDTFWQAAREIVAQCHAVLRPGGHAIWITKRFIRKSEVVEFSDQWLALCQSVGFELVCRHRAMLVTQHGFQADAFGEEKELKTERKSFFRRLHEKRPGAKKIDWEDVLCLIKR